MGHGKETPRQKMIGLMYLFLTCMLALNVSKDVLDAFITINDRLNDTNANFISKNEIAYSAIDKSYASNPTKTEKVYKTSLRLNEKSDSLVEHIQYYKDTIIIYADQIDRSILFKKSGNIGYYRYDEDLEDTVHLEEAVKNKDNTDVPAQIMVGPDGNSPHGIKLKEKVAEYREWALSTIARFGADSTSELAKTINTTFNTADMKGDRHQGGMYSWQRRNFEHLPLMAVITIMTQMQASVRNVEGDILNLMYRSLDAESFKFNKLQPVVLPQSTYIMRGNEYSAQIFLAAFDTTQAPEVEIGKVQKNEKGELYIDDPIKVNVDSTTNMATYETRGSSVGNKTYEGLIKVQKPNSEDYMVYKFSEEYQVAEPSLVVSPTKMNVFYIGPENPVRVSVPGISSDKIKASISPASYGTMSNKGGGKYSVKVRRPGTCKVVVSATINGKTQSMGSVPFRIKRVPDPVAVVLGKEGGGISRGELQAATRVDARMKDFDFDLTFRVQSFKVTAKVGQYFVEESASNSRISHQMKQQIFNKLSRGSRLYFEDIVAQGPDGKARNLGVLSFTVQ
ncbi:MAG: gliding motility protein GldM [Bacteroidales bacterium]